MVIKSVNFLICFVGKEDSNATKNALFGSQSSHIQMLRRIKILLVDILQSRNVSLAIVTYDLRRYIQVH